MPDIFMPKYYSLNVVEVAIACPLLTSAYAFINLGKAWGDDGGVEFELAEDAGDFQIGAGGFPMWVGNENNLVYANVTVSPGTNTYRKLGIMYADWTSQIKSRAQFLPIAWTLFDRSNHDKIAEPAAGFISAPPPNKVKSKTDQVFRFGLPNSRDKILRGSSNLMGA